MTDAQLELAEAIARVIALAPKAAMPDLSAPEALVTADAIRFLAHAHVALHARVRASDVVRDPDTVARMSTSQILAIYRRVTNDLLDSGDSYDLRLWLGMHGRWTDHAVGLDRAAALRAWAERTAGGTRCVSYADVDYYRIFPVSKDAS